jgi:hypothetical protein
MSLHKPLFAALSFIGFQGLLVTAALAHDVYADQAPPEPRTELAPPHRDGYVWGPGYWSWNGKTYHWVPGTYLVDRRTKHWVADHWEQQDSRWHYVPGRWEELVK